MGSLAKGMFCIRAGAEGTQFSRERERGITATDANVVLRISEQLPHRKGHR